MAENNTQDSTAPLTETTPADQSGTPQTLNEPTAQPQEEAQDSPVSSEASPAPVIQEEPAIAQPAPAPTPVSAPAPTPKVVVKEKAPVAKAAVVETTNSGEFDRLVAQIPANRLAPIHRLKEYIEAMHPKRPLSVEEGVRQQVALFKTLQNVINREDEHFRPIFAAILALFDQHKSGVFHETNVFRFMDNVTLNDNERKAFQRLVNLIKVTAAKSSRAAAIKQVNLPDSLRFGLTDEGRQRVNDFYNTGK